MTDHDDVLNDLGMAPSAENSGTSTATFGNNSPDPTTLAAALPTTEAPSSPDKVKILIYVHPETNGNRFPMHVIL